MKSSPRGPSFLSGSAVKYNKNLNSHTHLRITAGGYRMAIVNINVKVETRSESSEGK